MKREINKGVDRKRPIPYDEILEMIEGRIGVSRKDYILIIKEVK